MLGRFPAAINDPRLRSIKAMGIGTAGQLIAEVVQTGSTVQRMAIDEHFNMRDTHVYPDLRTMGKAYPDDIDQLLKLIEKHIEQLCHAYGVEFAGDRKAMVWTIYNGYGSFTPLDLIKFFHAAQEGRYKTEYQHIAARGINREFLTAWLDLYAQEKADAFQGIRKDREAQQPPKRSTMQPTYKTSADLDREKVRRSTLLSKADELRRLHFQEEYELKIPDKDGGEDKTVTAWRSSMQGYRKLHDFLTVHYACVALPAGYPAERESWATEQAARIVRKWKEELGQTPDIDFKVYARTQTNAFCYQQQDYVIGNPAEIIQEGLLTFAKRLNGVEELAAKIYSKGHHSTGKALKEDDYYPLINRVASLFVKQLEQQFWAYLEQSIDQSQPPLTKREYKSLRARQYIYNTTQAEKGLLALEHYITGSQNPQT